MIDTLLGKVAGLLEKDFLFSSFLPALIFLPALAVSFAVAVGVRGVWAWVASWSTLEKAVILAASGLAVVIFAYVVSALRTSFARFWSGNSNFPLYLTWPFLRLGESYQRWRFDRLRERGFHFSEWDKVRKSFESKVDSWYGESKPLPPRLLRWWLKLRVAMLYMELGPERVRYRLDSLVVYWRSYSGEGLGGVYRTVKQKLKYWDEAARSREQTDAAALDRYYGSRATVRATTLGNVIESYNQYAYTRYKIEAEIFWPRLQKVVKPEFLSLVQEPRILLDFALTMTSLGMLYGLIVLVFGPWLWFNYWLWGSLALTGFATSFFFYRVCVGAATQLGEMIRASFDLFRLDLMAALERPHPESFKKEQEQWVEFSKLVVYGEGVDFKIAERKQSQ